MKCPVCLTFGMDTEAAVQVQGTLYCGQHGVEAMHNQAQADRRPRGSRAVPNTPFRPPLPTPAAPES